MIHDTKRGHSKPAATALTSVSSSCLPSYRYFETMRVAFSVPWDQQQNQTLAATAGARSPSKVRRAPAVRGQQTETTREGITSRTCVAMNTNRDHDENADGSNSTNVDGRIARDSAALEHTARRAARKDPARRFDTAEKEVRADRQNRPVGTLTPTGRYCIEGDGDDAWITSCWAVSGDDAR